MPREVAVNKPLSGTEMRKLILQDVERLLDAEGLLSPHIAFGRCSWSLRLVLQVDNAQNSQSVTRYDSRGAGVNVIDKQPELAPMERFPLSSPSPESVSSAHEVTRVVRSPNLERVRGGIPIQVEVPQNDGTKVIKEVTYAPDPGMDKGEVTVADVTAQAVPEMGLPSNAQAPARREPTPEEAEKVLRAPAESRDFWGGAHAMETERDANAPWPVTKPS